MFPRTNRTPVRTRLGRPSPAMLVACAALFIALGGVGYAAATIGSAQIKNNSIRGKDIRNSTIRTADISKGTRDALKGQTGPQGPQGPAGPPGAIIGIVSAQSATAGSVNIPAGGAEVQIISKAVPAATYVVHVKTLLTNLVAERMECYLSANGTDVALDSVQWDSPDTTSANPVSMLAVVPVTSGPLRVRCLHDGAAMTPGGTASVTKLVAVPVSTVG